MELVYLVVGLALIEYFGFGIVAGRARAQHEIEAPAVTGHPDFERRFRVHQNTLEQLMIFVPSILIFSQYWNPLVGAAAGIVFVIGRFVYYRGYVADPSKRGTGFLIGFLAQAVLLLGAIIGAGKSLLA